MTDYKITDKLSWHFKNCPIYGGGYVTGLLFHPNRSDILYARTDIGGLYRFDFDGNRWTSLCDRANPFDMAETFPLSLAVSGKIGEENILLAVCGTKRENLLLISHDFGDSFERRSLPCSVHGNEAGRSTGERLLYLDSRLWFASQTAGLFYSDSLGEDWQSVNVGGEKNLTFIVHHGGVFLVGTSGECGASGNKRGDTLYSSQNGFDWKPVTVPQGYEAEDVTYSGFVPQKAAFSGEYCFVTFVQSGTVHWGGMGAYSCDTGTAYDGRVYRYIIKNGALVLDRDITPDDIIEGKRRIHGAYCACETAGDTLYVSTVCRYPDVIYASRDGGGTWKKVLSGLDVGRLDFNVSYMKPEYNGKSSCIHWVSDFRVSPFDKDFAVFNTGTGIFCTHNLTADTAVFEPLCLGLEETVHMGVYSLPNGKVLDLVGDLGGFVFDSPDKPCENTFADMNGNRYITCVNADFTDTSPDYILCTARGNWTGLTKGGVIITKNGGDYFDVLPYPQGFGEETDRALESISRPNTDSGWVALSADGKRIIWSLSVRVPFSPPCNASDMTFYTENEGKAWQRVSFTDKDGKPCGRMNVRIYSDRLDSERFYAVADGFRLFESRDKGESFSEIIFDNAVTAPDKHSHQYHFEARCQPDKSGIMWIANSLDGLYRVDFNNRTVKNMLDNDGDLAFAVGFGKGGIFISGTVCGEYGFYRSRDFCRTWQRLNAKNQCFGGIASVSGDILNPNRFYIATTTRGLLYSKA